MPRLPSGFREIKSARGVKLYRKTISGGQPDFVHVIDTAQGAEVRLLQGEIVHGGASPTHKKHSLRVWWETFQRTTPRAFSVLNGQFFNTPLSPTPLAFSLKNDQVFISAGYGTQTEYLGEKWWITLTQTSHKMRRFDDRPDTVRNAPEPAAIVGLDERADKAPNRNTGRTFLGSDGRKLYIFMSKLSTQPHAADILRGFGATKMMMLDGGGSTQMICQNQHYIQSSRTLPQVITVVGGVGRRR